MDRITYKTDMTQRRVVVLKYSETAQDEYEMLMKFDHPGIIKPLESRQGCLVLPYFPERSADGIAGYCSEKEVWRFLRDVADSLRYLHGLGYIHGDITPANVLISKDRYVLCDFDRQDDKVSLAYTPPEWDKKSCNMTGKSDIWSLGASAFYLLMGTCVFSGRGGKEQKEKTPVPSLRTDRFSEVLSVLIKKCLSFNPEDRPEAEEIIKIAEKQLAAEAAARRRPAAKARKEEAKARDIFWPEEMTGIENL